jgi:hypothetical protein
MAEPAAGDRAQDVGRSHRRMRRVEARQLTSDERVALLERSPLEAYGEAIRAATWLYAADELAAVMLRDVLAELAGGPSPGDGLDGRPLPGAKVALGDRLKLWGLALELAGELGLTTDARRRIGLELTPPPEPSRSTTSSRRGPRSRRVDYG